VCCGGVGLAAFPFSLIKVFIFRNNKRIDFNEWTKAQENTLKKTTKLLEYGKKINDDAGIFVGLRTRNLLRVYEEVVLQEEQFYNKTKKSYEKGGDGFIIPFCCMMCGICV
jgi:hypothetical protein